MHICSLKRDMETKRVSQHQSHRSPTPHESEHTPSSPPYAPNDASLPSPKDRFPNKSRRPLRSILLRARGRRNARRRWRARRPDTFPREGSPTAFRRGRGRRGAIAGGCRRRRRRMHGGCVVDWAFGLMRSRGAVKRRRRMGHSVRLRSVGRWRSLQALLPRGSRAYCYCCCDLGSCARGSRQDDVFMDPHRSSSCQRARTRALQEVCQSFGRERVERGGIDEWAPLVGFEWKFNNI